EILQETALRGDLAGLSKEEVRRRSESGELREWQADFRIRTRTGEERWLADSSVHILDEGGRPQKAIGILQDITERKRSEQALRESEERFRTLAENIPGVIYLCRNDERYTMLYLSEEVERLTGYPKEEFISDRVSFVDLYHPDDAPGIVEEVDRALAEHRPFHLTYRIRHSEGEWRWVEEWGTGLFRDGQLQMLEGFLADITGRRQAEEERQRLEAQVQHAQKLESLGVLAGGIAHDFNNLLVAMMGNAGLALMDLPPESPVRATIRQIEIAAQRAADLTNQLLAYSGKGKFIIEPINLSLLVREMIHLLRAAISKKAVLRCELDESVPPIEADATQIRQVVMNLITNASEALGDQSGVIKVNTGTVIATESDMRSTYLSGDMPEGECVYLEVVDTGAGMDQETLESIFDPFFTTKFTGRGLGLAAVLGIVRGHSGALIVESEVSQGTTFRVIFPRASEETSSPMGTTPESRETGPGWSGEGTVLIADDESGVRDLARRVCEKRGFDVLCAVDGRDAVEIFKARSDEIALVLLDMTMPRMDGVEVFDEMHRLQPDIPVILSSGFSEQEAIHRFGDRGLAAFIQKPYRPQALLDKIRDALGL
ncbi:PAS domain-containing protein, partial [Candidatus Sumerlaeota bacterium]|nr:PAS domain-containing protein [Candidatus Sumerlaeota bacterium]